MLRFVSFPPPLQFFQGSRGQEMLLHPASYPARAPSDQCLQMKQRINTIIFDFDYTLADSSQGVVECANYALGCLGYERVP